MTKQQIIDELHRWKQNRLMRGFSPAKKLRLIRLLQIVELQNFFDQERVNLLNRLN